MSTQFWDRLWRSAGIQFVILFIIGCFIYGAQPKLGSSPETVAAFYDGSRTRILIATFVFGMAVLNLLWFAAAVRSVLRDAGQDGWGAAVTASSAALGGIAVRAHGSGRGPCVQDRRLGKFFAHSRAERRGVGLHGDDLFPARDVHHGQLLRALARRNDLEPFFSACVAAVVLVLLGATTWATDGSGRRTVSIRCSFRP